MNFDFSEEQRELQNQINRHLLEAYPAERVMKVLDGDLGERKAMWTEFTELGYPATAIPEEYGGVGFGYLELCLMAQEIGRFAVPVPMVSSIYLAAEAILLCGTEEQKQAWLPKLASGEITATLAWSEDGKWQSNNQLQTNANGAALTGRKTPVADTDLADVAIVLANDENQQAHFYVVDLKQSAVSLESVQVVDEAWPHGTLQFDAAEAEKLTGAAADLDQLFNRAAVLVAFDQVGGAEQSLQMTKDYAMERYAFGRPIASYQALKHNMVDTYVGNELALSHAYFAAWALQNDDEELASAAAGARLAATQAYEKATEDAIQIHGGVGFTWEYACHIYYKRSRMLAVALGGNRRWKNNLIESLKASGKKPC